MTTPCYYCEEDRKTACKVCIHGEADAEVIRAALSTPPAVPQDVVELLRSGDLEPILLREGEDEMRMKLYRFRQGLSAAPAAPQTGWMFNALQHYSKPFEWDKNSAAAVLRRVSDASYGETDLIETIDFLRAAEVVRSQFREDAAPQNKPETCEWSANEDEGYWGTSCGAKWVLIDGTPTENDMKFCHCCGKRLVEAAAPQGEQPK